MSHITKQYVPTPPRGEAGEVAVCSYSFAKLKQGHRVPFARSEASRNISVPHSSASE